MSIRKILIYLIVLLAYSRVFAQDYEIRMNRAAETGERYELIESGSSSEQMTMSSQGQIYKVKLIFCEERYHNHTDAGDDRKSRLIRTVKS